MKILFCAILVNLLVSQLALSIPIDLIGKLGSELYSERAKAHAQLEEWIAKANEEEVEQLTIFTNKSEEPEVKLRLRKILKQACIAIPNTRGFIGVRLKAKLGRAIISSIEPGHPAEKAGLKVGDVIVKVNNKKLTGMKGSTSHAVKYLQGYLKKRNEGERLELKVYRGKKSLKKVLRLGNYDRDAKGKKDLS